MIDKYGAIEVPRYCKSWYGKIYKDAYIAHCGLARVLYKLEFVKWE